MEAKICEVSGNCATSLECGNATILIIMSFMSFYNSKVQSANKLTVKYVFWLHKPFKFREQVMVPNTNYTCMVGVRAKINFEKHYFQKLMQKNNETRIESLKKI